MNFENYPSAKLHGRIRLAYNWIDSRATRLLDAGCSYGYATNFYKQKVQQCHGIEYDRQMVEVARNKYQGIDFRAGSITELPYQDEYFDCIVLSDVLEHIPEEKTALNELYRVLTPGGSLIITTPHKGLFGIFDPYNYGYYLKRNFRFLYNIIYRTVRKIKSGEIPEDFDSFHNEKHRHYSKNDYSQLLSQTAFADNYEIEMLRHPGLFVEPLQQNLVIILSLLVKNPKTLYRIMTPFNELYDKEYSIDFGRLGFNIALKIRKK